MNFIWRALLFGLRGAISFNLVKRKSGNDEGRRADGRDVTSLVLILKESRVKLQNKVTSVEEKHFKCVMKIFTILRQSYKYRKNIIHTKIQKLTGSQVLSARQNLQTSKPNHNAYMYSSIIVSTRGSRSTEPRSVLSLNAAIAWTTKFSIVLFIHRR